MAIPSHIQRIHADRIARDQERLSLRVVKDKRKNSVHAIQKFLWALFVVQVEEHLAIRRGLKIVGLLQLLAQFFVVVDFAVHGQHVAVQLVDQRLRAVLHVHDLEPLVRRSSPARRRKCRSSPVRDGGSSWPKPRLGYADSA